MVFGIWKRPAAFFRPPEIGIANTSDSLCIPPVHASRDFSPAVLLLDVSFKEVTANSVAKLRYQISGRAMKID